MLDPDIDNVDFSNPVFDHEKAKLRDAAIAIQAWYRMWRHRIPYLQLRESALIVQVGCTPSRVITYMGISTLYVYAWTFWLMHASALLSMPICNFAECVERVLCTEDHPRLKTTKEGASMYTYMQHACR